MNPLPFEYKEPVMKIEHLYAAFDDNPVLRDVNVEVRNVVRPGMRQGQVIGLLGPSGMGKTTLFRILAGLDEPDEGDVLVADGDGATLKPVARGMVGVVTQDYRLLSHRTVMGNLLVAGKQTHRPGKEIREQANSLLTKFEMDEHASKYPSQLSGGQRQRVAIAQQFMCSEKFLLMDEPFSGLDILAAARVIKFIKDTACLDELSTFVVVTHDITAAVQVCDTLLLLGRDIDADGKHIPGARIQKTYNLMDMGLAWQEDIVSIPECIDLIKQIRADFRIL